VAAGRGFDWMDGRQRGQSEVVYSYVIHLQMVMFILAVNRAGKKSL
jgi:hypothetical protein